MMPGLGWMPDPPKGAGEKPDWDASAILGASPPPPSATCRPLILSVLDQGAWPTCVSHAFMQAVRACHAAQGVDAPKLGSRLWAHFMSRAEHGEQDTLGGTFYRTMFHAVDKLGFPPEAAWPYSAELLAGKPRWSVVPATNAFRLAFDQRQPLAYRRVQEVGEARLTAVRRAISQGRVVLFGALVTEDFCANRIRSLVLPPGKGDAIAGGHAMVAAEYDEEGFGVVNSWGVGWGDEGWCRFSPQYMTDPVANDFWVVEHFPAFKG